MQNHSDPYVASCPVGCNAPLQDTTIRVAEGALRRCTGCGQLLSRASETRYSETMAQFDAGQRYADFNEDTDKTAAYGLAALVGGGLAAKSGLLAKLALLLAKGWKLVLFAGIGLVALFGKMRGKNKDGSGTVR